MASSSRRGGGGDRVLESRHLVGLFLGVVLLCGVFFTLGYVMGRQQYGGSVHAADSAAPLRNAPPASASAKNGKEAAPASNNAPGGDQGWDFYGKNGAANDHLDTAPASRTKEPASAPVTRSPNSAAAAAKALPASTKEPARFQAPPLGKNAIVLQVAAVKLQRDALEMADAIQQKRFPSFVATSPADNFYHVQVGPYPDMASAESAKRALEQLGFKPIIKH
jgi:DedD protein